MTTAIARVAQASRRLRDAERTNTPCAPIRDLIGSTDTHMAYAVQHQLTQARIAQGARIVGRKIGLTSPAVQQQLGVDQPDFGVLFDDMDITGQDAPIGRLLQPKVEAELAFVLGADLSDGVLTLDRVRATVASTHAALEIVDSRIAGWDITFADTVADNASSGLFTLGTELPAYVEPRDVAMNMTLNGAPASRGTGAACLGDPLNALLWLAETARSFGDPLRAGQVVLSGALGPMAVVGPGDVVEATVSTEGHQVGRVSVRFTEEAPS